jgi:ABC-type phosphate/phosphonate transport system substrate-binding protein
MYDLPELRDAHRALIKALRALLQEEGVNPNRAAFTQICGYPLQTIDRGRFTLLGTPCYDVPGCDGPAHRAFIVVAAASTIERVEDLRGGNFAINSMYSNTGMNLPRHLIAPFAEGKAFFKRAFVTGSHRASMEAVVSGRADAAAIDCVTFGLHGEYQPSAIRGLRILAHTAASPSIPFVTARLTARDAVEGLRRAVAHLSVRAEFAPLRRTLRIKRIDASCEAAYGVLSDYVTEAVALGYPKLA